MFFGKIELPKELMQIYAKEMQIKYLRVSHCKHWPSLACCFSPPCSAGFIEICECVSDCVCVCVCEKVRNRNAELKDEAEGPARGHGVEGWAPEPEWRSRAWAPLPFPQEGLNHRMCAFGVEDGNIVYS